jgi:hypothetical protein
MFPTLSEEGIKEATILIEAFKVAMKAVATEALDELYMDIVPHIESDAWSNYRNEIMDGFRDYGNALTCNEHNFKKIRAKIFEEHKDAIIRDLNKDLVDKVKELNAQVERLSKWRDSGNY